MLVVLGVAALAVSAFALTGDEHGPEEQVPGTPNPAFPFSETVDAASARLVLERGGRKIYVARGQGRLEGMICVVTAMATVAQTGCDSEDVVQTRGILLSAEQAGDQLVVVAYLPDGFTSAELAGGAVAVDRNVLSVVVPRTQGEIVVTGPGRRLVLDLPDVPASAGP